MLPAQRLWEGLGNRDTCTRTVSFAAPIVDAHFPVSPESVLGVTVTAAAKTRDSHPAGTWEALLCTGEGKGGGQGQRINKQRQV